MTTFQSQALDGRANIPSEVSVPIPRSARLLAATLVLTSCSMSQGSAQSADLVYVSNVVGTEVDGRVLTSIEEQTAAALDNLGAELGAQGLSLSDVVVSNVFLRDSRHFQGMNGVYRTYFRTAPPTRATVQADLLDPAALIQLSVVAARGSKQIVTPSGLMSPELPYSWGVKVGSTLFVSGATSRSPETYQPVEGDVATQTRRIFGNIGMVLEAGGMTFADLVSCRVFLDDARTFGEMNGAYAEFVLPESPPARATVRSTLMNVAFSTEIQCVAQSSRARRVVRSAPPGERPLPYSPAIDTGDRVYLAGVTGRGADAAEEARSILTTLGATLAAGGVSFTQVEDVWVYLSDVRDWDAVRGVLEATLGDGAPEATVIGARQMGRSRVEIQIVIKR